VERQLENRQEGQQSRIECPKSIWCRARFSNHVIAVNKHKIVSKRLFPIGWPEPQGTGIDFGFTLSLAVTRPHLKRIDHRMQGALTVLGFIDPTQCPPSSHCHPFDSRETCVSIVE
jgi:hypothetical protein